MREIAILEGLEVVPQRLQKIMHQAHDYIRSLYTDDSAQKCPDSTSYSAQEENAQEAGGNEGTCADSDDSGGSDDSDDPSPNGLYATGQVHEEARRCCSQDEPAELKNLENQKNSGFTDGAPPSKKPEAPKNPKVPDQDSDKKLSRKTRKKPEKLLKRSKKKVKKCLKRSKKYLKRLGKMILKKFEKEIIAILIAAAVSVVGIPSANTIFPANPMGQQGQTQVINNMYCSVSESASPVAITPKQPDLRADSNSTQIYCVCCIVQK